MLMRMAFSALLSVVLLVPAIASCFDEHKTRLVDLPSALTYPRATYSLGVRIVPMGGLIAGLRVGLTDYLCIGVSYGAQNAVGSGEPDWGSRVEFDMKVRFAAESEVLPGIAAGYDSRGYGRELPDGGYEKASPGLYAVATKTLPFSEHWQMHAGVSRTLEQDRAKPELFVGFCARFSQEFSTVAEYQFAVDRRADVPQGENGYLNAGLRWVLEDRLQIDLFLRNILGPEGSPDRNSRSLAIHFFDSF